MTIESKKLIVYSGEYELSAEEALEYLIGNVNETFWEFPELCKKQTRKEKISKFKVTLTVEKLEMKE